MIRTRPRSLKLFSLLGPIWSVQTPTLVATGGNSLNTVILVNILKSGRSRSHGGGGLGGGYLVAGNISGKMISSLPDLRRCSDFLDAAGDEGVDIEL
jgi:hypothetical protein